MGQTLVNLRIYGPKGSAEVEALADTPATFTELSSSAVDEAGLETAYETAVALADGGTITRPLALADVEIDGVRRPVLIAVDEDEGSALVGYTTLETLGFKVTTVTHALEPEAAIELPSA